jgi:hypothetical protein
VEVRKDRNRRLAKDHFPSKRIQIHCTSFSLLTRDKRIGLPSQYRNCRQALVDLLGLIAKPAVSYVVRVLGSIALFCREEWSVGPVCRDRCDEAFSESVSLAQMEWLAARRGSEPLRPPLPALNSRSDTRR